MGISGDKHSSLKKSDTKVFKKHKIFLMKYFFRKLKRENKMYFICTSKNLNEKIDLVQKKISK